jgi:hypothetical protein
MYRPHGYVLVTGERGTREVDTAQCCHCHRHFEVLPNQAATQVGGYCGDCHAPTCSKPACNAGCQNFMRQMERQEQQAVARRKLAALLTLVLLLWSSVASAQVYVDGTSGSDMFGDGSSVFPYRTIAKCLSVWSATVDEEQVCSLADGTYPEPVVLDRFVMSGAGIIALEPTSGVAANVTITGTATTAARGITQQAVVIVSGPAALGIGVTIGGTAGHGIFATDGATVILRANVSGNFGQAVTIWDRSTLDYQGAVTLSGWSARGLQLGYGSIARTGSNSTLTVTGPQTAGAWGIQLLSGSSFLIRYLNTNVIVNVTGVEIGFQLGYNSHFGHHGTGGSVSVQNTALLSNSSMAQCADHSGWSTNKPLTAKNLTRLFQLYALSFGEAQGPRTLTNVGASTAVQNSVIDTP